MATLYNEYITAFTGIECSYQVLQVAKCLNERDDFQPVFLGHAEQLDNVVRRKAV